MLSDQKVTWFKLTLKVLEIDSIILSPKTAAINSKSRNAGGCKWYYSCLCRNNSSRFCSAFVSCPWVDNSPMCIFRSVYKDVKRLWQHFSPCPYLRPRGTLMVDRSSNSRNHDLALLAIYVWSKLSQSIPTSLISWRSWLGWWKALEIRLSKIPWIFSSENFVWWEEDLSQKGSIWG